MKSLVPTASTQRAFNGARALAFTKPKAGKARKASTISIKKPMWAQMLRLCDDDTTTAYAFIKSASWDANPLGHKSWSECVRVAALYKMRGSYQPVKSDPPKVSADAPSATQFSNSPDGRACVVLKEFGDGSVLVGVQGNQGQEVVRSYDTAQAGAFDESALLAADNNAAWDEVQA